MIVERIETDTPLGSIGRPARGRRPVDRFLFATCTEAALPAVAPNLGRSLAAMVGPTRCSLVQLQTARGDAVYDTLAELVIRRGQSRETVDRVAASFHRFAETNPRPVLVVAHCASLWAQSARLVHLQ